jgi:hypothetical protein
VGFPLAQPVSTELLPLFNCGVNIIIIIINNNKITAKRR